MAIPISASVPPAHRCPPQMPDAAGTVTVEPESARSYRPIDARLGRVPPSSNDAILTIRPGAAWLCDTGNPKGRLQGWVAFRGRAHELAVDLKGGGRLNGCSTQTVDVSVEQPFSLRLEATGCVVFDPSHDDPAVWVAGPNRRGQR